MLIKSSKRVGFLLIVCSVLIILILPSCERTSKEIIQIPSKQVSKESKLKQEIKQVIKKWCDAYEKEDYQIQWDLLSSKSPLRDKFTPYFSFDERMSMSEVAKNKAAFLGVSSEAFGPFKGYEVHRIVLEDKVARAYLVLHWNGHFGMGEAFNRPMRSKLTLELVKEKDKWRVFDEADGFKNLGVKASPKAITELVPSNEGSIVEIFPNQDRSAIFFKTETGRLGIFNVRTKKFTFLALSIRKDGDFYQAGWSPSGKVLGVHYALPEDDFLPKIAFFKKNGDHILTHLSEAAAGLFTFASDESIVWILGEEGSMEIVKFNLAKDTRQTLWDDERSREEGVIPLEMIGVYREKIIFVGRHYEGHEWEYSPAIVGTLDIGSKKFQKLTDKWFIFPGAAYALEGRRLAFLGGQAEVEKDTDREIWQQVSVVIVDVVSRKERVIKFLGGVEEMEIVDHFSWSPRGDEVAFIYGTDGLFVASVKKGEFQGVYPPNLDWENSRSSAIPEPVEIWAVRWSPSGNKLLFVTSEEKVFVASREEVWETAEIKALSERVDGNQCYWLSDGKMVFVGWEKAGEKGKPRASAEPKKIYSVDLSLTGIR